MDLLSVFDSESWTRCPDDPLAKKTTASHLRAGDKFWRSCAENSQIGIKIEKLNPQVACQNIGTEKFQTLPDLLVQNDLPYFNSLTVLETGAAFGYLHRLFNTVRSIV
jgi:hypothetical protein